MLEKPPDLMIDNLPMAGWHDEVQQDVDAIVAESGVTLDTGLLGENVVVLPLEVSDDL